MESKKSERSISYILTIPFKHNNKIIKIKDIVSKLSPYKYLVFQLEQGQDTGYKHYQLYVEFENARYWTSIQKIFGFAHIEIRNGTQKEAYDYCTKEDTRLHGPFEFGKRPVFNSKNTNSGLREKFIQAISLGASDRDLLLQFPTIFKKQMVDEYRSILGVKDYYEVNNRDLEVIYLFGLSGVGKSSYIRREHEANDIYVVSDYDKDPFGNYNGQDIIVFDEYRSNFNLTQILQYLDIYPLFLPSRYTNKLAKYTKVYVVSNWSLEQQYINLPHQDRQAFLNRFKYRIHITDDYITRDEYTRRGDFVKKLTIYNPLGNKSKLFPSLPTSFNELLSIGE